MSGADLAVLILGGGVLDVPGLVGVLLVTLLLILTGAVQEAMGSLTVLCVGGVEDAEERENKVLTEGTDRGGRRGKDLGGRGSGGDFGCSGCCMYMCLGVRCVCVFLKWCLWHRRVVMFAFGGVVLDAVGVVCVACVTVSVLSVGRDVVTGRPLCIVGVCVCALW